MINLLQIKALCYHTCMLLYTCLTGNNTGVTQKNDSMYSCKVRIYVYDNTNYECEMTWLP